MADNMFEVDGPHVGEAEEFLIYGGDEEWLQASREIDPDYHLFSTFDFENVSAQHSINYGVTQLQSGQASAEGYLTTGSEGLII